MIKKIQGIAVLGLLVLVMSACSQEKVPIGENVNYTEEEALTWQEQYDLGMRYLEEGDYEAAIVAFTAAIEIDPNQAVLYLERGNAYIRDGETEDNLAMALADYQQAVDLDSAMAETYLGIADVYIRQGDYDLAENILRTGLEKSSDIQIEEKLNEIENGNISDSFGNPRRMTSYDETGAIEWYYEYEYTTEYLIMKSYSIDGELRAYSLIYDDANGNWIRREGYLPDGTLSGYDEYQRDSEGRAVQTSTYNADGTLEFRQCMEYDEGGNCILRENYDRDGNLSWYKTYEYNSDGEVVKETTYNEDGSVRQEIPYKY